MKHFLKLKDYNTETILQILDLAKDIKKNPAKYRATLDNRHVGLLFQKHSTRTRLSFQVGIQKLGGHPILLDTQTTHIGRGESIEDTVRVFERYLDLIMIRTYGQDIIEDHAKLNAIGVINGLTDAYHPCQALSDLLTISELSHKKFGDMCLTYVGDANNMAASLMWAAALVGMEFRILAPAGYTLSKDEIKEAEGRGLKARFHSEPDPEMVKGSDFVYTDVWASMGQEAERQKRLRDFADFTVSKELLSKAPEAVVLHCLPAHKGEEIDEDVFEEHADAIFTQAENRMWAQMAIMVHLLDAV